MSTASAQITVELKEFATTQAHQVHLEEIAELHASSDKISLAQLRNSVVATISHFNQPMRIEAHKLIRIITRQHPALRNQIKLTGASAVLVTLPGQAIAAELIENVVKDYLQQKTKPAGTQLTVHHLKVNTQSLFIPQAPAHDIVLQPHLLNQFSVAQHIPVIVNVLVRGKRVARISTTAQVEITMPVYRLTRAMKSTEPLETSDYEMINLTINDAIHPAHLLNAASVSKASLQGMRARRNLPALAVLHQDDLEAIPEIARNQQISAELKLNGIMIEKSAIAQSDGYLGQKIKIADLQSATTYYAKVIAPGRVEIE